MSELDDYIKMNTDFLKLADGQSFEGIYSGLEFVADRFDLKNKNKIPCYKLKWTDIDKEIEWTTKSMKVAGKMGGLKPGDKIKITRHGEDTSTTYDIEQLP